MRVESGHVTLLTCINSLLSLTFMSWVHMNVELTVIIEVIDGVLLVNLGQRRRDTDVLIAIIYNSCTMVHTPNQLLE